MNISASRRRYSRATATAVLAITATVGMLSSCTNSPENDELTTNTANSTGISATDVTSTASATTDTEASKPGDDNYGGPQPTTDSRPDPRRASVADDKAPVANSSQGRADRCRAADISANLTDTNGAAGSIYTNVRFTNSSDHTCTLLGYPGVSYVGGDDGHQIGASAVRDTGPAPSLITLSPGERAHATLRMTQSGNFDQEQCEPERARGLRIYPPDDTKALFIQYSTTACQGHQAKLLTIQPMVKE